MVLFVHTNVKRGFFPIVHSHTPLCLPLPVMDATIVVARKSKEQIKSEQQHKKQQPKTATTTTVTSEQNLPC